MCLDILPCRFFLSREVAHGGGSNNGLMRQEVDIAYYLTNASFLWPVISGPSRVTSNFLGWVIHLFREHTQTTAVPPPLPPAVLPASIVYSKS